MNFFEQQERARKKTGMLVVFLAMAVIALIVITAFAVGLLSNFLGSGSTSISAAQYHQQSFLSHVKNVFTSEAILYISAAVIAVVSVGSIFKYFQINRGGNYVAAALGGRRILPDTRDFDERKVLNVVEEMAIASGTPVPSVYVMDDKSINAFAAGINRQSAVIGVTSGCITLLDRDELQGVIAHEFSHIFNGDMRLNMRLVAILHGILLIGIIGYYILRGAGSTRSRSSNNKNGGQVALLGLILFVIGYAGTFFGNLIKSAVSRQREFLADASAVQFTRNPDTIAGALKKIGGHSLGSAVESQTAAEFSHMFFSDSVSGFFSTLFATHPPLEDRIRRVTPSWDGKFEVPNMQRFAVESAPDKAQRGSVLENPATSIPAAVIIADALENIGDPKDHHLLQAQRLINGIPEAIFEAVHESYSARAVIYCLLLDLSDETIRKKQLGFLQERSHPATWKKIAEFHEQIQNLPRSEYIVLAELSIPALKDMSDKQYQLFKNNLVELIKTDRKLSVFEWAYYRIIRQNLEEQQFKENKKIESLSSELSVLFNFLICNTEYESELEQKQAFEKAVLSLDSGKSEYFKKNCKFDEALSSIKQLDAALNKLCELRPLDKPKLLKALGELILSDGKITPEEIELFRAIGDTINCPVPPLNIQ